MKTNYLAERIKVLLAVIALLILVIAISRTDRARDPYQSYSEAQVSR